MILTVTLNTAVDKFYQLNRLNAYEVSRVQKVNNTAGGKGLNVSRVAVQLGQNVTAMGFVGGHIGSYFESLITQPEITKAFTKIKAETRSCINAWDDEKGASTEFLEPGANVTPDEVEAFYADFARELPNATVVTLCGSVPNGVETTVYAKLIEMCKKANKPVLVDTSSQLLVESVKACPTFIKPNTDEIAQLLGYKVESKDAIIEAAEKLTQQGIGMVVVSLGADGAVMVCEEGVFHGKPPKINAVNTVGCGDSMTAGFAVGIAKGLSKEEQLRLAVAVSAANALCMSTGGYEQSDFDWLLPQVSITKIK